MQEANFFTAKNTPTFWVVFLTFFQIPSRTWGINFDTIACVFELVDGQKKCFFFLTFFRKKDFLHFWGDLSIHFPPPEVVKTYFENFHFFYPILPYFILSYPKSVLMKQSRQKQIRPNRAHGTYFKRHAGISFLVYYFL